MAYHVCNIHDLHLKTVPISSFAAVSARPIPQINFRHASGNSETLQSRLIDLAFVDNNTAGRSGHTEAGDRNQGAVDAQEGRDLHLVMIFAELDQGKDSSTSGKRSPTNNLPHNVHPANEATRLELYKLSRQELDVSEAFALLSPSDKSGQKPDIKDLSRLEWVGTII